MPPRLPSQQAIQRLFDNSDDQDLSTLGLLIEATSDTGKRLARFEAISKELQGTNMQGISVMLDAVLYGDI